MDREILYTASKWDILKRLESGPASPLELSKVCKTSMANISQQLRLLEMAGLVTSRKISNRDKGKPRVLYALAGNLSYMITTADSFVEKKTLHLSEFNKIIMRIWFSERPELHYAMEKAFWQIEKYFDKITYLGFDAKNDDPLTFYAKFKGKAPTIAPFIITTPAGETHHIRIVSAAPAKHHYVLYDLQDESPKEGENE